MVAPVFGGSLSAVDAVKVARLLAERDALRDNLPFDIWSDEATDVRRKILALETSVECLRLESLPRPAPWLSPRYGATCLERVPDWWETVGGAV